MATRNMVGRRLMSDADFESFNPFDEGGFDFIPEPVLQPAVAAPQPTPVATSAPSSDAVPSLEEILAVGPGNYLNVGGTIYQPVFQESGSGENLSYGGPVGIMTYRLGAGPREAYNYTDLSTGATQRNEFTEGRGFFGDLFSDVKSVAQDIAPIAAAALTMGGAGGLIGGTLSGGALSGTAASALGNALISGGAGALTGQDPLQAALLAAGGTYAGSLFGGGAPQSTVTDAQFIAADAAQLAAQGIPAPQIEQVLQASGVSPAASIGAADAAVAGLSVPEIAQEITVGSRGGLFTQAAPTTPSAPTKVTVSPEGLQTVTTTAAAPVANISDIVAAVPAAVLPQAATPMVDLPPLTPADQTIEITGTAPRQQTIGDVAAAINAGTLYGEGMTGEQTAKYDEELAKKEQENAAGLTLKDVYTALQALAALSGSGLFGGGGGGEAQQRPFVAPTGSVPTMDDSYYRAVQQYYNTFMPTVPRDVATPLQQWYEGKFGG